MDLHVIEEKAFQHTNIESNHLQNCLFNIFFNLIKKKIIQNLNLKEV